MNTDFFKPVEITIIKGLGKKEENNTNEPICVITHIYMEMAQ
jgi:hypothetical protein